MVDSTYSLRRKAYKKHKAQRYMEGWQFKIVIPDIDIDFDLYAKDISYGATEINTTDKQIGAATLTSASSAAPVILGVTIRDNEAGDFATWYDKQAAKIFNSDGTRNLSYTYKFVIEVHTRLKDGTEKLRERWTVFPNLRGDQTNSIDELGAYVSYPVSFTQSNSLEAS